MSWFERDHTYNKHWSERYVKDSSRIIPAKHILKSCEQLDTTDVRSEEENSDSDVEIDVETCDTTSSSIGSSSWYCADQKARMQMNECERHALVTANKNFAYLDHELVWEDTINKSGWGVLQLKIFNRVVKILQGEKLARLTYKGNRDEIVLRRLSVDRSASRMRSALASVNWNVTLTQWLHLLLIEKLPTTLLSYYLDIMQTLRSMVPALVERMIMPSRDTGSAASERLGILLKRPWDPAVTAVVSNMKQQMNLSHSILFIVVQCSVMQSSMPVTSRRLRFWNSLLSQIGKVVQVGSSSEENDNTAEKQKWTVHDLAGQTLQNIRKRIRELSNKHPTRKIVLLGWHTASLLNCHACLKEKVSAVVCLGFPMYSMFGQRGTVDDVFCDITTPVLFVVGDRATSCRVGDLEHARENYINDAMTSLAVLDGADDWLRVSDHVKRRCAVTQSMADRQILECICEFLHSVFAADKSAFEVGKKRLSSFADQDDGLMKKHKYGHEIGQTPERALLGKRHHSYADLTDAQVKRHRSSSPFSRRYPASASQLDDFIIQQTEDGAGGQLHGLSFNLQTGSISGLTALPGSAGEDGQGLAGKGQDRGDGRDASSRSITIDLTKDPNAQLSSALSSRRKSQLLQPTEKQTEDAIAAILGSDKSDDATSSHTAVMSPSADLRRFAKQTSAGVEPETTAPSHAAHHAVKSGLPHTGGLTLNLGAPNPMASIVGLVSNSTAMPGRSSGIPAPTGFARSQSFSVDQSRSFLASRSRKDDRETQQATAILEQLTSSLDTGSGSRSPSPDQFLSAHGKKLQGMASANRRRSSFDSLASRTPSARGRPRVYKQRHRVVTQAGPLPSGASALSTTKPSVVRYVLTSSGISGIVAAGSGGGPPKKVTLVQEGSAMSRPITQISSGAKPRPVPMVFSPSGRKPVTTVGGQPFRPTVKMVSHEAAKQHSQSSTPLVDMMLGTVAGSFSKPSKSAGNKASTSSPIPGRSAIIKFDAPVSTRKEMQTVTIARHMGKTQAKDGAIGGPVVLVPGSEHPKAAKPAHIAPGTKLLSITRPRAVSTGPREAKSAAPVARAKSDDVQGASGTVRMPALVLTKLPVDSLISKPKDVADH